MKPGRGERQVAAILFAAVFTAGRAAAQPASPAEPQLSPPRVATVPTGLRRQLERLAWLDEHGQAREAAAAARESAALTENRWLVAADDPRAFHSWRAAVAERVAAFSPAGLAAYRQGVEPVARRRLAEAIERRDAEQLRRVAAECPGSDAAAAALVAAGDVALERGEWRTARDDWQQVRSMLRARSDHAPPDDGETKLPSETELQERLIRALLRGNQLAAAEDELELLRSAAGGRRFAALATELKEARDWPSLRPAQTDWPALAATPARTNLAAGPDAQEKSPPEFEFAWSESFGASPTTGEGRTPEQRALALRNLAEPPEVFPIVVGETLAWQDRRGVFFRRLATGEPIGAGQAPAFAWQQIELPRRSGPVDVLEQPQFALASAGGVAWAARVQPTASAAAPRGRSELVAVEMGGSARLRLRVELASAGFENAVFASTPVVVDGVAAIVVAEAGAVWNLTVVGFDADSGAVRWRTPLGSGETPAYDQALEYPQVGVAAAEGVLVASTNLGMIAAVRIGDGAPLWLRTYRRQQVADGYGGFRFYNAVPESPAIVDELVVAAPRDAGDVHALELTTGASRWTKPLPAADVRLLGVAGGRVLLGGERPWALNVATGESDPKWGENLWGGAGQGSLAGDWLLWPVQRGVKIVNATTCEPLGDGLELPDAGGVAAFAVGQGRFIVATNRARLTVFRRVESTRVGQPQSSIE